MKPTQSVVLFVLGVLTKRVSSCTQFLQECTNCKAAHACGSYREMKTNITKCECTDMLEISGNILVEYDAHQGTCKSFNMCQGREETMGYNTFIKSCRTDCHQHTIETRIQQSGSCNEMSRVSVGYTYACLQFCLHRDGCMAVTLIIGSSGTITCIFHNCSQSVPEPTKNSTFIGITCSGIGVTSVENLPCNGLQTSQGPTTSSLIPTSIQTTFSSKSTSLSSAQSWDISTSAAIRRTPAPSVTTPTSVAVTPESTPDSVSNLMTTNVPKTISAVSLPSHTTNVTFFLISSISSPAGTTIATGNTTQHGKDKFFSKPSNIAAVSAAGGIAAIGALSASACLMMKKSNPKMLA